MMSRSSTSPTLVAVIGCGAFGKNHARVYHELERSGEPVKLVGVVDADFALKEIGDFVGHRSPASTQIYGKVAVEALRQVALGDGEEALDE